MQQIIKDYHIKAKKKLGQNFLIDPIILQQMAHIIPIYGKNIIEVGPGYGALSEYLLQGEPKQLTLVEFDRDMVKILQERVKKGELIGKNMKIIQQDILKYIPPDFEYQVIANIPYYITSPILTRFLYELENKPTQMSILMQQEVADRIVNKKSSVLSLMVEKKAKVKKEIFVPKKAFSPSPKVDSQVLSFSLHKEYDEIDDTIFLKFIKICFSSPRKTILNNLLHAGYQKIHILKIFQNLKIGIEKRPEDLNLEEYLYLVKKGII